MGGVKVDVLNSNGTQNCTFHILKILSFVSSINVRRRRRKTFHKVEQQQENDWVSLHCCRVSSWSTWAKSNMSVGIITTGSIWNECQNSDSVISSEIALVKYGRMPHYEFWILCIAALWSNTSSGLLQRLKLSFRPLPHSFLPSFLRQLKLCTALFVISYSSALY